MKKLKLFFQLTTLCLLTALIGCNKNKGVECGSVGDFSQQEFNLNISGIGDISFQNFAHVSCFQGNYWADTYGRGNYNINGFQYYTRQSKLEINMDNGAELIIDFNKAFLYDEEDKDDANWHAKKILNGDFVYGIDGLYVENPPYTSQTALLWANYPTVVNITYYDEQGREWRSEDVKQLESASFNISGTQEHSYSPEGASTTQYDFNMIASGKITCTLKSRDALKETKQLIEAPFKLPFHLTK